MVILHRIDRPSKISYREDGSIARESWYVKGLRHREDGPARVSYHEDGSVDKVEFWYKNRKIGFLGFLRSVFS